MKKSHFFILFILMIGWFVSLTTPVGPSSVLYVVNWTLSPRWNFEYDTITGSFFSGIHLSNFRVQSTNRESVIQSENVNISFYPWHFKTDNVDAAFNRSSRSGLAKLRWEKIVQDLRKWMPESEISSLSVTIKDKENDIFSKFVGSIRYSSDRILFCNIDSLEVKNKSSIYVGKSRLHARLSNNHIYIDSLLIQTNSGNRTLRSIFAGTIDINSSRIFGSKFDIKMHSRGTNLKVGGDISGSIDPLMIKLKGEGRVKLNTDTLIPCSFVIRTNLEGLIADSIVAEIGSGVVSVKGGSLSGSDTLRFEAALDSIKPMDHYGGVLSGAVKVDFDLLSGRYGVNSQLIMEDIRLGDLTLNDLIFRAQRTFNGNANWSIDSDFLSLSANNYTQSDAPWLFNFYGFLKPKSFFPLYESKKATIEGKLGNSGVELELNIPKSSNIVGDLLGQLVVGVNWIWGTEKVEVKLNGTHLSGLSVLDVEKNLIDTLSMTGKLGRLNTVAPWLGGTAEMSINGSGLMDMSQMFANVDLRFKDLEYFKWRIGSAEASGTLDEGRFSGEISGVGWELKSLFSHDEGWKIDGEMQELALGQGQNKSLLIGGSIQFRSEIPTEKTYVAAINLNRFDYYNGKSYLSANKPLLLSYRENGWKLRPTEIETSIGLCKLHGSFLPNAIKLEANIPEVNLKSFPGWTLSTGGAYLSLSGSLQQPKGNGWVAIKNLTFEDRLFGTGRIDMTLTDSLRARAVFRQKKEEVAGFTINLARDIFLGSKTSRDYNLQLNAWSDNLNLAAPLSGLFKRIVSGSLTAETQMQIPISNRNYAASLKGILGKLSIQKFTSHMVVGRDSVGVELFRPIRMIGNGHSIKVEDCQMNFSNYDRDNREYKPSGIARFSGAVSGRGELDVSLEFNEFSTVNLGLPEGIIDAQLVLIGEGDKPKGKAKFFANMDDWGQFDGVVNSDAKGIGWRWDWTTPKLDKLTSTGGAPWANDSWAINKEDGWVNLTTQRIDLSAFSESFVDIKPVSGIAEGQIFSEGLDSAFTLSGDVKFDEVKIKLLDFEPYLPLPHSRIKFFGQSGSFFTETGYKTPVYESLDLSGIIGINHRIEPNWDVSIKTVGLNCRYADVFRADEVNVDLSFIGDSQYSNLSGKVSLINPLAEPVFLDLTEFSLPPPPAALKNPLLENMRLDMSFDVQSLNVDSELVQVLISGGIGVGGTFYKPIFQGDASIEEGRVIVFGRPFELDPSNIVFDGLEPTKSLIDVLYDPLQLDPNLDFSASTSIIDRINNDQEYSVKMTLEGSTKRIAPRFQSTPELDFNRIVNLLAFGTTEIDEFNYGTAISAAAGQLLSKRVERAGIDEFSILPSTKIIGVEPGETVVRMGKLLQMPFSVWVRYEAALSRMGQGEVTLEHRLNSFLTLTGAAQSEYEHYGLGIGFKKEF